MLLLLEELITLEHKMLLLQHPRIQCQSVSSLGTPGQGSASYEVYNKKQHNWGLPIEIGQVCCISERSIAVALVMADASSRTGWSYELTSKVTMIHLHVLRYQR
jgi:hypothetical protein